MYIVALSVMGFEPFEADNADDAFARACDLHPDAVVVDVTLQGASGLDLTRRLREDPRTKNAGVLVLTGHAVGSAHQQALDAGCDRFLLKPCLPDTLALEIHAVLATRHHIAELESR
jgi:two-component system cell cycle response regulator DivK